MATRDPDQIPDLSRQPVTVDFIDNKLPQYHPAFNQDQVYYDVSTSQYLPKTQEMVPLANNGALIKPSPLPLAAGKFDELPAIPVRPEWSDIKAMRFWNSIFTESMSQFCCGVAEPKQRFKIAPTIRGKANWDDVYDVLEASKDRYVEEKGSKGWFRKVRRRAADGIMPVAGGVTTAVKMAPDDPYATPVLGAIHTIMQALKTASKVRREILAGLDNLEALFSDVELFLGTFPEDFNIRRAAVDLTATTLEAVEQTIGFFESSAFSRAGKAMLMGNDYESGVLESLRMIKERSRSLMEEAAKSHMYEFHMYSVETRKLHKELSSSQQTIVHGINSINQLLADHLKQKDRELEAAREQLNHLAIENGRLRSHSSLLIQSAWARTPSPLPQTPVVEWYISPQALRRILECPDIDIRDTSIISSKRGDLPAPQRAQAEQIVATSLFQQWIVSPTSAKLLVEWDTRPPKTVGGVSPLSVFCTTMAQALRANERFLLALWFCGLHCDLGSFGSEGHIGGRTMLISLIDQLLRQHTFDMRRVHKDLNLEGLQQQRLDDLLKLLEWLIQRLPQTMTLFCIIDGVVFFERPEFEEEALKVFGRLMALTLDKSTLVTVKILFTSTPGTDTVRSGFEQENLILSVSSMPKLTWAPSEERMVREMEMAQSGDSSF